MKKYLLVAALGLLACVGQLRAQLVVATTVSCATSTDGSVVGVQNPLNPPVVAAAFSGTLPAGNYYTQIAWYDAATHATLVSPEVQTQLTTTGALVVNAPTSGIPASAVGMNVYVGASSGAETMQGITTGSGTFTQSTPLATGLAVPAANTTVCAIVANDAGWPTGTGYNVSLTTPAGNPMPGFPMQWQLLGPGSSINVSNGFPLYNGTVNYPTPIQARPYNHAQQSISGPLSLTGYKLTQVLALGVGTSVPAWPIDVENGSINASTGFIYNGGIGVTTGQCLIAGSDSFKTFTPQTCSTLPTLFYQTVEGNGTPVTQQPLLNFTSPLVVSPLSGVTTVGLAASGVTAGTYNNASVTVDGFGRVTAASSGVNTSFTQNNVSSTRVFGTAYANTGHALIVTGYGVVTGGGDKTITCSTGTTSALGTHVFSSSQTGTISGEAVGFTCDVPAGFWYGVTVSGNIAPSVWIETVFN